MTDKTATTEKQEILDEALQPDLSSEYFDFECPQIQEDGGVKHKKIKVQIKPLKVKYRAMFQKVVKPYLKSLSNVIAYRDLQNLDAGETMEVMIAAGETAEVLPEIVRILCLNDGYEITEEEMGESTLEDDVMLSVLGRYLKKVGKIEEVAGDFFIRTYPMLQGELAKFLGNLQNGIMNQITNPSLSKESAKNTGGRLTTSKKK